MQNRTGSALIFVSLLVAFVGIIVMLFARNTTLYYGFTVDRMQYARSQYALEALAQYGIARCIATQKTIEKEWEGRFKTWPPPDGPYQGMVKITSKDAIYNVNSELLKNDSSLGKIQCVLRVSEKNEAVIQDWTYS